MLKTNSIFIAVAVLASACTQKTPETLISRWEMKVEKETSLERALASAPQGQCLKDLFSVETLSAEVKDLEKKFATAAKVSGTWKHLDLSKLPVPQANFLKTFGNQIGDLKDPESIDYSSCSDVPCIFNKIYKKENHLAGYVHYIWYLRLGHLLAADNKSPSQASEKAGEYNGKIHTLDKYLYADNELYALWRLTQMLKTPHSTLSYLKEVQRIPRGEGFEGKDMAGACGLAYSQGWILLNDGCLTVDWDKDLGYLYQAVTHEMSHQVDFQQGRGSREFYRSHKQDYLDLSGFFLTEYVDEEGKTVKKWNLKPGSKLPTGYGGTAPQENFAESLAVFRHNGDLTKGAITAPHFKFVSDNYYQTRSFEREELIKTWIQQSSAETGKAVFKSVIDCSKTTSSPKSPYFKTSDFTSPVLPGMLNCFGNDAVLMGNTLKTQLAIKEPEGCLVMNNATAKPKWDIQIKEHLRLAYDKYLAELQKDKDYLARIQNYYAQLSDKTIARSSYVQCFAEADEEDCFNDTIAKAAYDKALLLKLPPEQTQEMADMYVSYHSYQNIEQETKQLYQSFVAANLELIRTGAEDLWVKCQSGAQNDDQTPVGALFTISDGYMISSLYNCLNTDLPESIVDTIGKFSVDGVNLKNGKEELILSRSVQPEFIKILKAKYSEARDHEVNDAFDYMSADKGELRKKLLSNFEWVKNVIDEKQIFQDCKKEGYKLITFQPLYALKSGLFSDYLEKNSCLNINSTPEYNQWLESSKESFNEKVASGLDDKILELGMLRATECLKQYPIDSTINKIRYRKQREACLIDEWPKMENKVLQDASKDPLVQKFQMSPEVLRGKVETSRRRLQVRVLKEKFN
jgi:hypothetical protein